MRRSVLYDAHSPAVAIEYQAERDTEYQQHRKLAQGDAAALHKEIDEIKMQTADKEEVDLESYDDTVEDRRHQERQERDLLDAHIAQQIHRHRREQTRDRAEDHVVETESGGHRADIRDHTADGKSGDRRGRINRQHRQYLRYAELDRHRGGSGQQQILTDRQRRVHSRDRRRLRQIDKLFVFHILFSPLVLV